MSRTHRNKGNVVGIELAGTVKIPFDIATRRNIMFYGVACAIGMLLSGQAIAQGKAAAHKATTSGGQTTYVDDREAVEGDAVDAEHDSDSLIGVAAIASAHKYFQANGVMDGRDTAVALGDDAVAAGASLSACHGMSHSLHCIVAGNDSAAFGPGAAALGVDSTAVGAFALALGEGSSAFGFGTTALGDFSTALGYGSSASGLTSMAFGYKASSNGDGSIAIGNEVSLPVGNGETAVFVTHADGLLSTAIGPGAASFGEGSTAIGPGAEAFGDLSMAFGYRAQASLISVAIGTWANASGSFSVALGPGSKATGESSVAVGEYSTSNGVGSVALGSIAFAQGDQATAVGFAAMAWRYQSIALGNAALADGDGSTALGYQAHTWGDGTIAFGYQAQTGGTRPVPPPPPCDPNTQDCGGGGIGFEAALEQPAFAVALGQQSQAFGTGSLALGYHSLTLGESSVALGAGSMADRDNTVSVGAAFDWVRNDGSQVAAFTRQIVNVADGTQDNDAVNVGQLSQVANALGGGASMSLGVFTSPNYSIQGGSYYDVGAAFAAVDGQLTSLHDALNGIATTPGPQAPQGPAGDLAYDDAGKGSQTLASANDTQIRNVAAGVSATDAVNKGQMDAGDSATLSSANQYTDTTATKTLTSANAYTDSHVQVLNDQFTQLTRDVDYRLAQQDKRIDKMGAMSSAMMTMSINAAGSRSPRGRVAVGAGWQNGESALSVGYAKSIGDRASFSIGGAFTDDDQSAGIGFGIDL